MSIKTDPKPPSPEVSGPAYERLSPEEKRRIGTAMRLLVKLKELHLEGMDAAGALLEGKVPASEAAMKLMDFERALRIAANDFLQRPLKVAHEEAVRRRETKLVESAWLTRTRIMATEARQVREEAARQESLRAFLLPSRQAADEPEPEAASGMRP